MDYLHRYIKISKYFGRELVSKLPIMKLFIFSILVFLRTKRESVALRANIHFVGTLWYRFFKDRGRTSSIYVSIPKDFGFIVYCQSNIAFSELRKSTLKHFVKSVQTRSFFWSVFSRIWTVSVFSSNVGKYGPEQTPYLDTFHAVKFITFSKLMLK